jgi:nucleoside-diphosphate-sugar epimerase
MRILITGVNGFIGRHMANFLCSRHEVLGVTRPSTSLDGLSAIKLIFADLSVPGFVEKLPSRIDCIIHLAQSTQYRNFPEGTQDMRCVNIDATCELLEWARIAGVQQFIFSSTANVYGKSNKQLTEADVTQPESFYGASKLAAEHLAKQYQAHFQVDVLRLFTVYGPGQRGMLIPNIADRMRQGQSITLADGVGLTLSPIYVGDVAEIAYKLMKAQNGNGYRLFNVCGHNVNELSEIVSILEEVLRVKANIKFIQEGAHYLAGSNNALKNFIDLGPMTGLKDGLSKTFGCTGF